MIYSAISLFTGAGGLDFGLEAASFETTAAIEMDSVCCRTLRHNRPDWTVLEDKIENISSRKILGAAGLSAGEVDILVGGPPCQPFSKSSYWLNGDSRRLKDPRARTLNEYMRVLGETRPRAFILENVFGMAYKGKDEGLVYLKKALAQINRKHGTDYSFSWKVINAADYGVPQIRERVFIVGCREGTEFRFPEKRYFEPQDPDRKAKIKIGLQPYRTAWDALHDLEDSDETYAPSKVGGSWGYLLPTIPEGSNYLFHTEGGGGHPLFKWRSRYWSFLLKLAKDRPSWTIQAQPGTAIGPFHWKNRRLTMREMCRLQTFPDDILILGKRPDIQKQIGNAVPSAIGELLALEIRRQFFGEKRVRRELKLAPKQAPIAPSRSVRLAMAKVSMPRDADLAD